MSISRIGRLLLGFRVVVGAAAGVGPARLPALLNIAVHEPGFVSALAILAPGAVVGPRSSFRIPPLANRGGERLRRAVSTVLARADRHPFPEAGTDGARTAADHAPSVDTGAPLPVTGVVVPGAPCAASHSRKPPAKAFAFAPSRAPGGSAPSLFALPPPSTT